MRSWRDWWSERFAPAESATPEIESPEDPGTLARPRDFDFEQLPKDLKLGDVVSLSLETAEAMITRFRLASSPPDVLIEFGQDMASTFDFHRAGELIAVGPEKAVEALDRTGL